MPVRMTEAAYKPIEKDLRAYFYEFYWRDILEVLNDPYYLYNSNSALIAAIRAGSVHYESGVFTGKFNAKISRELSKFARFDGRSKSWTGIPPSEVTATATVANTKAERLNIRIQELISEIPSRVKAAVEKLKYSIDAPLFKFSEQAGQDLSSLGVSVEMTPELSKRLSDNYTNNQNLNIVNWTDDQIVRLRDMTERNALSGYNRLEFQQMIASEYNVTMNKAKFLARQETSLFMAEVRDERYQDAGITRFKWSAIGGKAGDGRTRELHRELSGQVFSYSSPPIIDERTGERGVPGQAFGCRCTAIPVL